MIDRLYVGRGDRTSGPFSAAQLRGLAAAGRIRPTDAVWREGAIEKSVDAAKVRNLFPSPPTLALEAASEASEPTPPPDAVPSPPPSEKSEVVPAPAPAQTAAVPPPSPVLLTAGDPTSPSRTVATDRAPRPPEQIRKRRAVAVQGATVLSQDGVTVHYRKKCTKCGFEDRCRSSMPIGNGMTRIHFYCPECRKGRDVQIQGIIQ